MNNVLIVDDNYYFATGLSLSLCMYLKHCNVLTAGSGRKALEIMESLPVDFIVTDLEMPSMDGYELVASVKKKHPELPVFIMTEPGSPSTKRKLAPPGHFQYISKPFGFKELAGMIAAALGASSGLAA